MYGWRSDRQDFAYPSFALALAQGYFMSDPEIESLVNRRDAAAVEQLLLDKALIVPIVYY
jgi:hypothetical protein